MAAAVAAVYRVHANMHNVENPYRYRSCTANKNWHFIFNLPTAFYICFALSHRVRYY